MGFGIKQPNYFRNGISVSYPSNWYDVNNLLMKMCSIAGKRWMIPLFNEIASTLITSQNESLKYKYKGMDIYTSTGNYAHNEFLGGLGYSTHPVSLLWGMGIFRVMPFWDLNLCHNGRTRRNNLYENVSGRGN